MANVLHRMASPVSQRRGLVLAVLAMIMTGAGPLASVLLSGVPSTPGWVLTTVSVAGALGLIPLLMAAIALVGRPVKPAWLVGVALVLVLIQPISWILESTGLLYMLHTTALLIVIATGSAAGVIAAGLVPVRDRRIPLVLLIPLIVLFAAGVSIAATVIFMFRSLLPLVAGVIALLLAVEIMRHREDDARDDVAIPESVTGT